MDKEIPEGVFNEDDLQEHVTSICGSFHFP